MDEIEFNRLASQGYNRIPLISEAFADLETPLSLYLKLCAADAGGKYSFLLESVVGGERFGRFSFIGLPVVAVPIPGKMPIAVQIITAPWREDIALRIAHALQTSGVARAQRPEAA